MENSRNERIYLVIASYIIGFVTAFIAFGLTQDSASITKVVTDKPAKSVTSQVVATAEAAPIQLSATERGLEFIHNGDRLILTANAQNFDSDSTADAPGFHQSLIKFELSPDGTMVYFCDVPVSSDALCRPYVFVIAETTVYPVTVDGERLLLDASEHSIQWGEAGLVSVAGTVVDVR